MPPKFLDLQNLLIRRVTGSHPRAPKPTTVIAHAEAIQAWLENVTYQMCNMVSKTFTSYSSLNDNYLI